MELQNSKWLLTGPLMSADVILIFRENGLLDFIERNESLGRRNTWRRQENQVEFSVCHPLTMIRHTHFSGRLYGSTLKGTCFTINGDIAEFEAVLIERDLRPADPEPMIIANRNVSFFLAHGMNLN